MARLIFSVLSMILAAGAANADITLNKVIDGSVAYCDSTRGIPAPTAKVVQLSLISSSSSEEEQETTLRVSLVKCQDSQWVLDSAPTRESYVAPNGVKVEITYSNYEMLLANKNSDVLLQTDLEHLNQGAVQERSVFFYKTREVPQDVDVIIRTRKNVKADNGVEYSESVTFGSFRIRLN
ncbi:hypothetical protein ACES2J_15510 [Bdellovibrio bacteriovorus]|uniref:hypothetical protein n=1 Tax=Bdellovibrio bacteriovorus TaxID=959 RepID=UPI0035A5D3FC